MNRTLQSLLALALAGGTFTLAAQDAPKPAAPAAPAATPVPAAPAKTVTIAAPAGPAASARNIRFQFDGIPYADVIERFAQMANKPLLAGTKPEGTLTYNDANAYTYAEALDTLNVILSMKGVMLVENANYLQLVPFKELPSTPLKLLRGAMPNGDVRPGEVVTAVLDAKNVDSKEITESLTAMLSNAGSLAVLPRGRGLIITDRLGNIQRIKTLLAAIETDAPAERQMKTFALQHTSGAIVADLLNRTFGVATAPKRQEFNPTTKAMVVLPPDPNEYITAVFDDASRTMVLFGPRERIALAEELIAKFEEREGPAGDVRIYMLQSTRADELATIIRQAIPGIAEPKETGSAAATKARVIADEKQNRLIVASPVAALLEQIDLLINRVDKGITGNFGGTNNVPFRTQTVLMTKVFRPRATEPKDFAAIVTQALTRREPGGKAGTTASVTFDAGSKSVVISGSPGDLQTAAEILTQLETGTSQPQAMQTRFIEVGTAADAKRLLPLVDELYRNQMSGAGSLDIGAHAKLMSDDNGRLIVTASEAHLLRIEELVKQLRGKNGAPMNRQLQIVTLKNTRLETVFPGFEKLLTDRMADRRYEGQPKPSVVPDNANNRMLVTATPEQLTEIEQLVQVVDLAPTTQRREMVVLPVRAKAPTEIITLATQLLAQMGGPGTDPQMEPKLIPDASGKQIIVLATAKDLTRVRELVTQLDTATTVNLVRQFRSIDLNARSAVELTPLVTQLYAEHLKGQNEPPGGAATLIADPKNNRIMVSGADAEITRVEAIIRQLDPAGKKPARDETRVVRLKSAVAADLAGLVEKSLNAQSQSVKVLVDTRSNSLVLSGEPDAVEAASKVIQQLDTSSDAQPREMRVVELKQGDATSIAALATPLVTELLKSQRGPEYAPSVKIVADATSNRLILSGPHNELTAVSTIVEQLDQAPEGAGGAKVFKLNNATASKVVNVVSNAMVKFDARNQPIRRVTVSADPESNSIVVAGTRADLKDAENIIQRLDNEGIDPSSMEKPKAMKIVEVRGDADALATLATKVFLAQSGGSHLATNLVSITPNGRRIIVLAPPAVLPQVESLLNSLDAQPDQTQRELHAVQLKNASATELLPKVTAVYTEQSAGKTQKPATIYADPSGVRLTVYGTKQQAESIQQIADTLAGDAPAARETKVIDLGKLAEAKRVMALAQQVYKDQLAATPQLGAADAQMISDGVSGRVIINARAEHLKTIEDIFARFQPNLTATPTRETKTIDVGTANDVERLLPLVQKLYLEQWKDKPETDPADAQMVADPQGGRVIVTGRPEHVKEIEALFQKLGTGKARSSVRDTRIFDLTAASAVELAATVKLLYLEQAKARFGARVPDTLITPDTGANRLIVVGEKEEVEAVAELIKKLDTTAGQSATARVFKIKSADPAKVAEVLGTALVRFDAAGRAQKRVTVSVDAKTRTLIVTGDAKELQAVPAIIEQLDQSLGEQPSRRMQVVALKPGVSTDVAAKARKFYDDQLKSQPELALTELLVMEDAASNQLILAGSDEQLKLYGKILDDLQAMQAVPGERVTRFVELGQPEEVLRVLPLLRSLYEERWKNRSLTDPADATIMPDSKNSRIILSGRTNHLAELEAIIAQVRGKSANDPRETRFFDLVSSDVTTLAATLRPLYLEQARSRPGGTSRDTLIIAETNSNRLIVTATTNELDAVAGLVKELDKSSTQNAGARIFRLKIADPAQITEILTNAFVTVDRLGRPTRRISVVVDAKNRSLIATGEAKDLQAAAQIIEQLDVPAGTDTPRTMRIFSLKGRRATETAPKIKQVFEERARTLPDVGTAGALIIEDIPGNQLIFVGTEKQLALMQDVADVMDKAGNALGREVRVIQLQRNSAAAVAATLARLYPRQTGTVDREDRMLISTGGDDNTLIVDANRTTLEQVEQLVRVMESEPTAEKTSFQTVQLTKGRAEEVATAVMASYSAKLTKGKLPRTTVTPVSGANTLLINGPSTEVDEVMKVIQNLDVESKANEIEIRIYKLENGKAKEVSEIIQQLLQTVSRGKGKGVGGAANVVVDERANSLLISGTQQHFKVVEKILPTLDKAPERSERDVQFVWLKKAKALDVVSKLEGMFTDRPKVEQPVIEADSQNNSITIIARRNDLAQIQDLINRLDEQSKDNSLQVRLRPLDRVVAEQMAKMLQNIYPQMSRGTVRVVEKLDPPKAGLTNAPTATPATNSPALRPLTPVQSVPADTNAPLEVVIAVDKSANSLILSGPSAELDNIDRIINDLSLNFYSNEAEFRLFPLKDADPVVVARTLNELLHVPPVTIPPTLPGHPHTVVPQQPRITVVAEQRTRSVIVRARPTDFTLMESLIKQLDENGQTTQLEFRVVPLTNAPPDKVLPLVQQMITQLNVNRPGEPVTVAIDPRSRGLLLVGRDSVLKQVEKMIQSLDKPAQHVEAEVMVYSLKKASATQLALVLQNMIRPGLQGTQTPEARELQEQVRRLRVLGDSGEAVMLDLTKPIKIVPDGTGGGNRLLLTSTPDNLKALVAVVELMDTPQVVEGVNVRIIKLQHADAATVSTTLQSIFTQGKQLAIGPSGPGAQPEGLTGKALVNPVGIGVDARSNTLILSGQNESIELASKLIEDLDKPVERFVTEVKLFRLKHASALRLVPLLQSVFAEGPVVPGTEGLNTQITRMRTLKDAGTPSTTERAKARAALIIQADDLSNILIVAARSDMVPLIGDVVEQLDIPSASGLETVRIFPLAHAEPAVVQKILADLYTAQKPGNVRNEDKPVITVDERTGALIVAGNAKSFAIIEGLLKQLDQKLPFDLRDIRILPLEHADATVVAGTLQKLMDARLTQRVTLNKGQSDALKVVILADNRSNSLLIGGGRDSFEMVETLAKQLDNAGPALSGRIRLIPLQFADARLVATTMTTLFDQRYSALRATDVQRNKPVILADPRSNSLLITANQDDNRAIDELLLKLDNRMDNPSLQLTVIPLKHNDAARVGTMIESIFTARRAAQTLPGQPPLPSSQIKLEPDALNNALVASASKENLELIQELIKKLDAEPVIAGGVLEVFTLKFADATRVGAMLTSLVQQGLYRPGHLPNAPKNAAADKIAVSVDARANLLFVSASPETMAVVREVVKRLDTQDQGLNSDVRLYQLKHARASTLAVTLTSFFTAKQAADNLTLNANVKRLPATAIPDDRINTILITGGKEAFDFVERMLPQLDGESTFSRLNFRVFAIKKATAAKLQTTLQPIFANRPPRVKGEPNDPVTIIADSWVNALLVGANVEDLGTVETLLNQLDTEPAVNGLAIHVFPLAKADVRKVALTIQGLFRDGPPGAAALPGQQMPVQVTADERINALVVSCGEVDAKRIGELVKRLDTEQVARVAEIRVFPLKNAKADQLSTILNSALNTKPVALSDQQNPNAQSVLQFITRTEAGRELITAGLKEAVLITADARMNSLIVSGPVDYMGLIEQIINRLDASSPQEAKIKVFALKNASARAMADILTQMFRMTTTATTGNQRTIQYTLVRPGGTNDAASATLGTAEQAALTVTVDPRTNSLLVGGTDHYVQMVEQIIESLDGINANDRRAEVVRLKNTQAGDVAVAVRTFLDQERLRVTQVLGADAVGAAQQMLEREVSVVGETNSNTLLLSASPRYFLQIQQLITELDMARPQVMIQLLLAEVTLDDNTDVGLTWSLTGGSPYSAGLNLGLSSLVKNGLTTALTGGDTSFILNALKEHQKVQVLSRPQIVTADNKPASINVGQRVPLITSSQITPQGGTVNAFTYEDIGVNLTVTPKISPDGFVRLELGTTNSSLASSSVQINSSATVPIINQRRANTTVSVQSGQTIIIGGLIGTQEDRNVRKVPFFGDIPYLGSAFRHTTISKEKKELLIFLTPQVLANVQVPVPLMLPGDVLQDQLERSKLKEQFKRNDFNQQLLDPIFPPPTATPPGVSSGTKPAGT